MPKCTSHIWSLDSKLVKHVRMEQKTTQLNRSVIGISWIADIEILNIGIFRKRRTVSHSQNYILPLCLQIQSLVQGDRQL